jgi:hypothetical protein
MAMASGGVTKMQDGGMSPFGTGFQGQGVPNIIDLVFQREMAAAQAQREAAEAARQQAATRSEQMQEQARRDALSQALVGIGTGIARGDMAGGFAAGAQSAQGRMKEARTEAMRASDRAEQLALAREEAARKGELGAFTRGAELRLGMQQGQQKNLPASLQELEEARRIMSDPNASEADKAWAAGVFGTAEDAASTPAAIQEVERANAILGDENASPAMKAWARRTLYGDRSATQENFEYFVQVANDPERSDLEREAARQKLAGSGFSFEQTADGTIRLSQGPQGLTTGTTTRFQQQDAALDLANRALSDLKPLVEGASPAAFGRIGSMMESGAAISEQLSALPGVGGAFGSMSNYLSDEDRTNMRTAAELVRGQLLPIITGEPSRFTNADVERADEAVRILNNAGSKTQALIAVANLESLMRRAQEVIQERMGTNSVSTEASASPPAATDIPTLEAAAKARGLDLEAIRRAAEGRQ